MKRAALALSLTLTGCASTLPKTNTSVSPSCLPAPLRHQLDAIEQRFGKVTIVSTYRKGATIAGTNHPSYHRWCRAVDFHPPKGRYTEMLIYLKQNFDGGIGTYSGAMHHLHIDDGSKKLFHTYVR